jgi:DNA-directed RNA polymerase specialized sigma24 family protein
MRSKRILLTSKTSHRSLTDTKVPSNGQIDRSFDAIRDVSSANPASRPGPCEQFQTTHWSVILAARQNASQQCEAALQRLCAVYWYPLYVYVRRRGFSKEDAQDLTQGFFSRFLQYSALESVHPSKGRFRSFLLASMNNFLANEWDRANAQKRGGQYMFVSLDDDSAEARYLLDSVADHSAERMFDRGWALTLLEHAMGRLREECLAADKKSLFEKLKRFIPEEPGPGEYAAIAGELGWTRSALAVAVHRLRQRYRELVREEVAQTVAKADEVDGELRELLAVLK